MYPIFWCDQFFYIRQYLFFLSELCNLFFLLYKVNSNVFFLIIRCKIQPQNQTYVGERVM